MLNRSTSGWVPIETRSLNPRLQQALIRFGRSYQRQNSSDTALDFDTSVMDLTALPNPGYSSHMFHRSTLQST